MTGINIDKKVIGGDEIRRVLYADLGAAAEHDGEDVFVKDIGPKGTRAYSDGTKWIFAQRKESLGYVIRNLLTTEYVSELAQNIIAGTGTPTIVHDDATGTITMELGAGLTGRAFKTLPTISYLAGHTYCISFKVGATLVKPAFGGAFMVNVVSPDPTVDFGTWDITMDSIVAGSTQAVIFQPTTTQSLAFRVGLGLGGNVTAGASDTHLEISEIQIEDLSYSGLEIPGNYVEPRKSIAFIGQRAGSLAAPTQGELTLTTSTLDTKQGLSVAIFGDSYSNDSADYPAQLQGLTNPRIGVWYQPTISKGVTVAGTRPSVSLVPFQTKLQALIDAGKRPTYTLLQSSLNTIANTTLITQDANIDADIAAIRAAAIFALSVGVTPILTNIPAWKAGATTTWIVDSVYYAQQKYDSQITALAHELGVPLFNLRACTEDAAVPYLLDAAYNSGDDIHPNSPGMLSIATRLQAFITSL